MTDYAANRATLERRVFRRRMLGVDDAGEPNGWGTMSVPVAYRAKDGAETRVRAIVDDQVEMWNGEQVVTRVRMKRVTLLKSDWGGGGVATFREGDTLVIVGEPPGRVYGFTGEVVEETEYAATLLFRQYDDVQVGINARAH